jgi:hypothetical protein
MIFPAGDPGYEEFEDWMHDYGIFVIGACSIVIIGCACAFCRVGMCGC